MKNGILGSVNALTMAHDNFIQKRHSTQSDLYPNDLSTLKQPTNTQANAVINNKNLHYRKNVKTIVLSYKNLYFMYDNCQSTNTI